MLSSPPFPPLVLSGHAASLTPYQPGTSRLSPRTNRTRRVQPQVRGHLCALAPLLLRLLRHHLPLPPRQRPHLAHRPRVRVPHPVLIGHAASLTPYQPGTSRPSPRTNRTRRVQPQVRVRLHPRRRLEGRAGDARPRLVALRPPVGRHGARQGRGSRGRGPARPDTVT